MDQQTYLTNGEAEAVNQVSVTGSHNGTLCWKTITGFTAPTTYLVSFENDTFLQGGLQISITGELTDKTFRFTTDSGICYEGELEKNIINIFNQISVAEKTPTPTPTPKQQTPTPTQNSKLNQLQNTHQLQLQSTHQLQLQNNKHLHQLQNNKHLHQHQMLFCRIVVRRWINLLN